MTSCRVRGLTCGLEVGMTKGTLFVSFTAARVGELCYSRYHEAPLSALDHL